MSAVHRRTGRHRRLLATPPRPPTDSPLADSGCTRRHSRIAFSARGNPANRYVCSTNSSTHSAGIASRASEHRRANIRLLARGDDRREANERRASRRRGRATSRRVALGRRHRFTARRIRSIGVASGGEPNLADDFAARVANRTTQELLETRRQLCRKNVEQLENAQHGRELRALRAVVDLYGEADALLRNRDRVHALGADLRDGATLGLFDEHGVESIGAADEKRARSHRVEDPRRNLVLVARGARETRPGARHVLERERERDDAASVDRLANVRLVHPRPLGDSRGDSSVCTWCSRRSYPYVCHPAVCARASIAACLPEQLLCVRVRRAPDSRSSFIPRVDSGSCGPQARSPSSMPMSLSIAFGDRDVLRFAAVRRAGERQLVVAPVQRVKPARREQRHHLERLRARPPGADELRRMRAGHEGVVGADDCRMHTMARFDFRAASRDNVQLERFHAIGVASAFGRRRQHRSG